MKTRRTTARAHFADIAMNLAALVAGSAIAAPFMMILASPFIGGW
ncbi:MAG: hypothetical protein O3A96_14325 [Proteobacteria bacterium]|nr:hypothetical protein [Pseudomonadota bacterium]